MRHGRRTINADNARSNCWPYFPKKFLSCKFQAVLTTHWNWIHAMMNEVSFCNLAHLCIISVSAFDAFGAFGAFVLTFSVPSLFNYNKSMFNFSLLLSCCTQSKLEE